MSKGDLKLLQIKHPIHLLNDEEHSSYILDDFQTINFSANAKLIQMLNSGQIKLCNDKGTNEDIIEKIVVLEKRSTIFSVHDIVTDSFIEKDTNVAQLLVFAGQDSVCLLMLKEALIFMTIVNFIPGTYNFSNKHSHPNLSIIQHLNLEKLYLTEDGQSFMKVSFLRYIPFHNLKNMAFYK